MPVFVFTYHNNSLGSMAREVLDLFRNAVVIVGRDVDEVFGPGVENDVLFARGVDADHAVAHGFGSEAHGYGAEASAGSRDDDPLSTAGP